MRHDAGGEATERDWAIGVDLGGTKLEAASVDRRGRVLERRRTPTETDGGPGRVVEQIVGLARELVEKAGSSPVGVGVGVAGQIDPDTQSVVFAPNLDWRDVPLRARLASDLDLPVAVTNDVRAATWGEWLHGAGRDCDDLVVLFVGTGIGGGIVSGGRMLAGCRNTAGELGHVPVAIDGPACRCGGHGCLEAHAAGRAIERRAREAVAARPDAGAALLERADGHRDAISARLVADVARGGDPLAREILDAACAALATGVVGIVNALNPCRVVLGGGVVEGLPEWIDRAREAVRSRALEAASRAVEVTPAALGGDAGVVGAGALALRERRAAG